MYSCTRARLNVDDALPPPLLLLSFSSLISLISLTRSKKKTLPFKLVYIHHSISLPSSLTSHPPSSHPPKAPLLILLPFLPPSKIRCGYYKIPFAPSSSLFSSSSSSTSPSLPPPTSYSENTLNSFFFLLPSPSIPSSFPPPHPLANDALVLLFGRFVLELQYTPNGLVEHRLKTLLCQGGTLTVLEGSQL